SLARLRATATAMSTRSPPGSLSRSSNDTQPRRGVRFAHCANNVVLPYPAGATIASTRRGVPDNRPTRLARSMIPFRVGGGYSLDSYIRHRSDPAARDLDRLATAAPTLLAATTATYRSGGHH